MIARAVEFEHPKWIGHYRIALVAVLRDVNGVQDLGKNGMPVTRNKYKQSHGKVTHTHTHTHTSQKGYT